MARVNGSGFKMKSSPAKKGLGSYSKQAKGSRGHKMKRK